MGIGRNRVGETLWSPEISRSLTPSPARASCPWRWRICRFQARGVGAWRRKIRSGLLRSRHACSERFHHQPPDAAEFGVIVGHNPAAVGEGGGGYPHVVPADELPCGGEGAVDFAVAARDLDCPWQHKIRTAEALPVGTVAGRLAAGQFIATVNVMTKVSFGCWARNASARPGESRRASRSAAMTKLVSRISPMDYAAQGHASSRPRRNPDRSRSRRCRRPENTRGAWLQFWLLWAALRKSRRGG